MSANVYLNQEEEDEIYVTSEVSLLLKYSLFALNFLFSIIGLFLSIIGLYAKTEKQYSDVVNTLPWYLDPVNMIILVGIIVFVLSFIGWFGALRENVIIIKIFEYAIDITLMIEIVLAVYIYVDRKKVKNRIEEMVKKTIPKYRDDEDLQSIIDYIQLNMKCCGAINEHDWNRNIYFNCSTEFSPESCGVPFSCCIDYEEELNRQCGYGVRRNVDTVVMKVHQRGCVDAMISFLFSDNNMVLFVCVSLVLVLLQLITTGLAHSLVRGIRRQMVKWKQ